MRNASRGEEETCVGYPITVGEAAMSQHIRKRDQVCLREQDAYWSLVSTVIKTMA